MTDRNPSPKGTILIVDEQPTSLNSMVDHLDRAGFEILSATSGEEGLARARHARPDLISLDVMLQGLDGFEICRRLKGEEATKDIPVMFMTALDDTVNIVKGFEAGGVDYLSNSAHPDEVVARIAAHLSVGRAQRLLQFIPGGAPI